MPTRFSAFVCFPVGQHGCPGGLSSCSGGDEGQLLHVAVENVVEEALETGLLPVLRWGTSLLQTNLLLIGKSSVYHV